MRASLARTIAIATLVGCVTYAIAGAFGVDPWTVAIVSAIAVAESDASWRYLARAPVGSRQRAQLRLAELGLLLVAAKVVELALAGPVGAWTAIETWPFGVATATYGAALVAGAAAWGAVLAILDILSRIGEPGSRAGIAGRPLRTLGRAFLWGGFLITITTAMMVAEEVRAPTNRILWPAFVYFGVGLIALGIARRAEATAQWEAAGATVPAGLSRRWNTLVPLMVIALLVPALAIPVGDSTLLLEGFVWVGVGIAFVAAFLVRPFLIPAVRLVENLRDELVGEGVTDGSGDLQPTDGWHFDPGFLWDVLVAVLWLGVLVAVGVIVYRQRRAIRAIAGKPRSPSEAMAALVRLGGLIVLGVRRVAVLLWEWLGRLFGRRAADAEAPTIGGIDDGAGGVEERPRWTAEGARLRISEIYRRLEGHSVGGGGRRPHETPQEYLHRLPAGQPQRAATALTAVYEEARFSRHTIADVHVATALESWEAFEGSLPPDD